VSYNIDMTDKKIAVDVDMLFSVTDNSGTSSSYSDVAVEVNDNFFSRFNIVEDFVKLQIETGNFMPLSKLVSMARDNGFTFETIPYGEDTVLFFFIFEDEQIGTKEILPFAVKYDWGDYDYGI